MDTDQNDRSPLLSTCTHHNPRCDTGQQNLPLELWISLSHAIKPVKIEAILFKHFDMPIDLLPYHDALLLVLRIVLALIFIGSALHKLKNPSGLGKSIGWPDGPVRILGLVELLGALGIVSGVYLQESAIVLALVMLGALYHHIVKWKTPFMPKGWSFDLLILATLLALAAGGGGSLGL